MYRPIIIIGAGRSGTKFLRDMLGCSSEIGTIPYDVGYVWRYGNENFSSDEFTPNMATESVKKYVVETLPKLIDSNNSDENLRMFIEKSVPNTLRPSFIKEIYPNAKFIHLIRDGRAVTESSIRMWSTSPNKGYFIKKLRYFPWSNYKYAIWYVKNNIKSIFSTRYGQKIWGPRYHGIDKDIDIFPLEKVCARQWKRCVETALCQLNDFPKGSVLEVRYEDLISSQKCIEKICEFLEISDKKAVVDSYNKKIVRNSFDKWKGGIKHSAVKYY